MSNYNRWRKIKNVILGRDQNRCLDCGINEGLVTHHLDGSGDNHHQRWAGNNTSENLITLCRRCHMKEHWKLAREAGRNNLAP